MHVISSSELTGYSAYFRQPITRQYGLFAAGNQRDAYIRIYGAAMTVYVASIIRRFILGGFLAVASICPLAIAARDLSGLDVVTKFVEELKAKRRAVFLSECQPDPDSKAVLILPVGDTLAHYAILAPSTIDQTLLAIALGGARISGGQWKFEGGTGGLTSGPAQVEMIKYLEKRPFKFVDAKHLDHILDIKAAEPCKQG